MFTGTSLEFVITGNDPKPYILYYNHIYISDNICASTNKSVMG